ncbi:hypothetical protein [Vibrio maritimus]
MPTFKVNKNNELHKTKEAELPIYGSERQDGEVDFGLVFEPFAQ